MGNRLDWHDDWIIENYTKFHNWTECRKAYNKEFGTDICRATFRWHAAYGIGLRLEDYQYGADQDDFLREYYPVMSGPELVELYNKKFKSPKTYDNLRQRAEVLKLKKTAEYMTQCSRESALKRKNIAPIGHMAWSESGWRIKVGRGEYKMLSKVVYEEHYGVKLKPDECVIYLDGDNTNVSVDNLAVVSKAELAQINHSLKISRKARNVELSKAAVAWAKLYISERDRRA